jgi:tetratricopeptide (TPR) repeat protein
LRGVAPLRLCVGWLWLVLSASLPAATPAEQKIAAARRAIEQHPREPAPHNALALAFARRARETSDPKYYDEAADALKESLRLAPDNFEARKVEAWIALGKHEFARALELTRALSKRSPDDVLVYALLTDACIETGHYDEAEKSAQWALDMRPGEISGLTRAAYLRELFGQIDGAIELMQSAYNKTAPTEVEDRAWILTQFAHLVLLKGDPDIAERALADALALFPGYHYALGQMVKVRTLQKRFDDAAAVARDFVKAAPHPENLYVLGEALACAGKAEEAREVFADFEKKALAESETADNANRELVFYFADRAAKPADALRIAKLEMDRRHDLFTRHAYAWALHVSGQSAEARAQLDQALAIGIRDPVMSYHAGIIAAKLGDSAAARRHFDASLAQSAKSEVADLARAALARMPGERNE